MAYMSREKKASIAPVVKAILKKYNVCGSLSVSNHSTLVLKIKSSPIDFVKAPRNPGLARPTYLDVNFYNFAENYSGVAKDFLTEIRDAMNDGNHNNSDTMADYFDVGWYTSIHIGSYDKPYLLTKS